MSCFDRRATLRLAILAAAVPASAAFVPFKLRAAPRLIAPPDTPMHYARRYTRDMRGDAYISVYRQYEIVFTRFADGFIIDGKQLAVSVDAPDELAAFAEIERRRLEVNMFPMVLDPFGVIVPQEAAAGQSEELQETVDLGVETLAEMDMSEADRAALTDLVTAVGEAEPVSFSEHFPSDLFCPPQEVRVFEEVMALPDGNEGKVTTRFEGDRDEATGLMRTAKRTVTTEIGDTRRNVFEEWELQAP